MKLRIPFLSDWLERLAMQRSERFAAERAAHEEAQRTAEADAASLEAARVAVFARIEAEQRAKSLAAYEAACAENDRACAPLLAAFPVGSRIHFLGVTMVVESVEAEWRHEEPRAVLHASWFDNDGHLDSRQFLDGDLALLQAENARGAA